MNHPTPTLNQKFFEEGERIVSKTNLQGHIVYCNSVFMKLSGYKEKELLGKNHNIVRHPDMPKLIFYMLWQRLKEKKEIIAYVKNLCKDGSYYWVLAFITPSFNEKAEVIGYHSMRLKPSSKALKVIEPLYKNLLEIEQVKNLKASQKALDQILNEKGLSYDEFVLSL